MSLKEVITSLQSAYPQLNFLPAGSFYWSPENKRVFYNETASGPKDIWALLHETGHGLLGHKSYRADFELLKLEMAAWEKAQEIAKRFNIKINEDHIEDCLDTYRDWLHARSICPTCTTKCLQQSDMSHYRCFNCHTTWRVTPSRFARPYRSTKNVKRPSETVFHASDHL